MGRRSDCLISRLISRLISLLIILLISLLMNLLISLLMNLLISLLISLLTSQRMSGRTSRWLHLPISHLPHLLTPLFTHPLHYPPINHPINSLPHSPPFAYESPSPTLPLPPPSDSPSLPAVTLSSPPSPHTLSAPHTSHPWIHPSAHSDCAIAPPSNISSHVTLPSLQTTSPAGISTRDASSSSKLPRCANGALGSTTRRNRRNLSAFPLSVNMEVAPSPDFCAISSLAQQVFPVK